MDAGPSVARLHVVHQPRRPGYAKRYPSRRSDMIRATLLFTILLGGCGWTSETPAPSVQSAPQAESALTNPVTEAVSIAFSERNYTFSTAAAARGIEIAYEIIVRDDVPNVLPLSQHSQSNILIDLAGAAPDDACVLEPFATLSGNEQFYGEFSAGCLAMPITISPARLPKGSYSHVFSWTGLNLPSDGGGGSLPYGAAFPPGEYVLNVRCIGTVLINGVPSEFEVANDVKLTLTD